MTDAAAAHARMLLGEFGTVARFPSYAVIEDWARCGAMALTGSRDGPPIGAVAGAASVVRGALQAFASFTELRTGATPPLPDVTLLGERAAIGGLRRQAPWSVGGSARAIEAHDGWWMLSLPRPSDVDLIAPLTETKTNDEVWSTVTAWSVSQPVIAAVERAQLLGLAASVIEPPGRPSRPTRPAVLATPGGRRTPTGSPPLVIDLTSLWAGPLGTSLLALAGADVVKVESTRRPDGARLGPAEFFTLLNSGKRNVAIDFTTASGRRELRSLIESADVVVEASRPRALRQLGIDAEQVVERGTIWASITAYGRQEPDADRVGFGDDVAAAAGLVVEIDGVPCPCGDAIADPLAGVHAAVAVAAALLSEDAQLLDISMRDVAAYATAVPAEPHTVTGSESAGWTVTWEQGRCEVAPPTRRRC